MHGEKAWRPLHKNAASNTERDLEAAPNMYGHLPPIMKTIQVRRTIYAGHCWRSRDELISDVLLWTPSHGQAKAGRPTWTYIQQLCADTGCSPEKLPEAMSERVGWRARVRDIHTDGAIWWWWQLNSVSMLKWIFWNGTIFEIETVRMLNWIV